MQPDTDALAELIEQDNGDSDQLGRVGKAALGELLRRLEDPGLAEALPGTGLLNIAASWVKVQEKQLAKSTEEVGPQQDPIDMILNTNLPGERKHSQLLSEQARTRARLARIDALLEGADEQLLQRTQSNTGNSVSLPEQPLGGAGSGRRPVLPSPPIPSTAGDRPEGR